jgi:hypothetical protein
MNFLGGEKCENLIGELLAINLERKSFKILLYGELKFPTSYSRAGRVDSLELVKVLTGVNLFFF